MKARACDAVGVGGMRRRRRRREFRCARIRTVPDTRCVSVARRSWG